MLPATGIVSCVLAMVDISVVHTWRQYCDLPTGSFGAANLLSAVRCASYCVAIVIERKRTAAAKKEAVAAQQELAALRQQLAELRAANSSQDTS